MTISVQTAPANAGAPQAEGPNDAALAAKVDAQNAAAKAAADGEAGKAPAAPERPAWLPEKFATVEDFAKSYSELEAKLGQPKTPEVPAKVSTESAEALVTNAGLDFSVLSAEVASDGKLSEASVKALLDKGIPQTVIDSHVEGLKATAQLQLNEAYQTIGGEARFTEISTWAAESGDVAKVETYNALIESGKIKEALTFLNAAYDAANGKAPARIVTGRANAGVVDGDVYGSRQEVTADMSDPRYGIDSAFRAKVQAKLGRSNVF